MLLILIQMKIIMNKDYCNIFTSDIKSDEMKYK